jgi:predicted RNase H-like HicB family nuclease/uncharacterized damage-inducible protein DinB
MPMYALHVESGPQRKTTMAHVLRMPGAISFARTTDEAVAEAPEAIRNYLRYLKRHGEKVDPKAEIRTRVAEHVTEGGFISTMFFTPDLEPVTPAEVARWTRWLEWSRADLLKLVDGLTPKALEAKPATGRSIRAILEHVVDADRSYLYSVVGTVKSVGDPTNAALRGDLDLKLGLRQERAAAVECLRALTPAELRVVKGRRSGTRTTRRAFRRMLEHEWEHRQEIAARLGVEP